MLKKKVVLFWEMFYSGIQSHNSKTQKVIRKEIQKVRKVRKTQDTLSCVKSCINKWWSGRNVAKGKKKKKKLCETVLSQWRGYSRCRKRSSGFIGPTSRNKLFSPTRVQNKRTSWVTGKLQKLNKGYSQTEVDGLKCSHWKHLVDL